MALLVTYMRTLYNAVRLFIHSLAEQSGSLKDHLIICCWLGQNHYFLGVISPFRQSSLSVWFTIMPGRIQISVGNKLYWIASEKSVHSLLKVSPIRAIKWPTLFRLLGTRVSSFANDLHTSNAACSVSSIFWFQLELLPS